MTTAENAPAITLTSSDLSKRSGEVRKSVKQGAEPGVSWRGEVYAFVVLRDKRLEERDRMAQLEAELEHRDAELERRNAELERRDAEIRKLRSRLEEVAAM
ncbi:hypothetical protein [Amycolatopsis sp. NPDC004079]|uniref:hypothetical protein n=1 Tax=Amycolatopsis sp. NPDC004079 TaxID=3154549 RepID=UPI0033B880C1